MATTGTYTCQEICTDALRKARVVAIDEAATADDLQLARRQLNRMLKSWQNDGPNIFLYAAQTVTLTTAASYTMSPVRPLEILTVNYNDGSSETPMQRMTRQEYESLPVKTSTGTPTCFYYDRQKEAAKIYIWPVLASASGETLEVDYVREFADVELADDVDVPGEYYDAVVYNLADRLSDDYGVQNPNVTSRAQMLYQQALAFDREGSVYFHGDG